MIIIFKKKLNKIFDLKIFQKLLIIMKTAQYMLNDKKLFANINDIINLCSVNQTQNWIIGLAVCNK